MTGRSIENTCARQISGNLNSEKKMTATQLAVEGLELEVLTPEAMQECTGGALPKIWRVLTPVGIAIFVIENWSDVKKGITDGFNLE